MTAGVRLLVALAALFAPALGSRVLVVMPLPVYSHNMPFLPILRALAEKGHQVTLIANYTLDPPPDTLTHISLPIDTRALIGEVLQISDVMMDAREFNGPVYQATGMWKACPALSDVLVKHFKPLLPDPSSSFDLILGELFFCQEFIIGLSHYYNAPFVALVPGPLTPSIAEATGNPQLFSVQPNLRLPITGHMSFLERVWNTVINMIELIGNHIYYHPQQDKVMRNLLDNTKDLPYIRDLFQNIALVLTETNFAMNYPRPYLRNILEVGGASMKLKKTLPKELDEFMNNAKDGVIYFSWGSHYTPTKDPQSIVKALFDVFSKFKQRVVLKWTNSSITGVPENVLVSSWVPQLNVLAHNKTLLFISHCGLNSVYEAAYFGVPVVGTPLFGDQPHNSKLLESFGMGITVDPESIKDGVSLLTAIKQVLSNPSFKENAEKRRKMLQDRPIPILEETTYWLEYVMNHSGAKHLRPTCLPWYSSSLLDVWLFLIISLLSPFIVIFLFICGYKRQFGSVYKTVHTNDRKNK